MQLQSADSLKKRVIDKYVFKERYLVEIFLVKLNTFEEYFPDFAKLLHRFRLFSTSLVLSYGSDNFANRTYDLSIHV